MFSVWSCCCTEQLHRAVLWSVPEAAHRMVRRCTVHLRTTYGPCT
jgi:hypothetical protein